ncbi:MAG: 50S ribosomal protein L23 [Proteobacteria bacterium]|nr:50S ribosomal protein L23 [Pseudomonadota bacterium]
MKVLSEVLRRPIVTEKANILKEQQRKIVLEVAIDANKNEIKQAAEKFFGAKVENVRTSVCRGKIKRVGKTMGKCANTKKAVLTIKEGSDLDVFGVTAAPAEVAA